jgi:hypothetical protein
MKVLTQSQIISGHLLLMKHSSALYSACLTRQDKNLLGTHVQAMASTRAASWQLPVRGQKQGKWASANPNANST